jgi:hypothetical protein
LAAVLAVVIGTIQYLDHRRATSGSEGPADGRLLLPVPVEQVGALEIADAGRLHRFERDPAGTWFYHGVHAASEAAHTHVADPALSARIERAVEAFGRTRRERDFALERDGAAYGVASPELVVLVYGPRQIQPLAQYAVGHVAPDAVSRYVMVVGQPVVVTIPNYQIENLLALVRAASGVAAAGAAAPPAGSSGPASSPMPASPPGSTSPSAIVTPPGSASPPAIVTPPAPGMKR